MEVFEPKVVNSGYIPYGVNPLRLGGLQIRSYFGPEKFHYPAKKVYFTDTKNYVSTT